jgi:hypothetical protein
MSAAPGEFPGIPRRDEHTSQHAALDLYRESNPAELLLSTSSAHQVCRAHRAIYGQKFIVVTSRQPSEAYGHEETDAVALHGRHWR